MAQYYTLEEAAKVLRMPAEELREKAKKKEVRAFQDRGNWRFLAQQIDEMARLRGEQQRAGRRQRAKRADRDRARLHDEPARRHGAERADEPQLHQCDRAGEHSEIRHRTVSAQGECWALTEGQHTPAKDRDGDTGRIDVSCADDGLLRFRHVR